MLVVSPWSTGGWVCSETFDHTSLIRLIETRFGVTEPNLTPWRRAVCGDLASAFDFSHANNRMPSLPSTAAYKPSGQSKPTYTPTPRPSAPFPRRNRGCGPRAALVTGLTSPSGPAPPRSGSRSQTQAHSELTTTLPNPGTYDLSLHGPNGFFRHFAGSRATVIVVESRCHPGSGHLRLRLATVEGHKWHGRGGGRGAEPTLVQLTDTYGRDREIELHLTRDVSIDTNRSGGWYDIGLTTPNDPSFAVELAGRLESAVRLTSDPQLGRSYADVAGDRFGRAARPSARRLIRR